MTNLRRLLAEFLPAFAAFAAFAGVGALAQDFIFKNPESALPILLAVGQPWALTFLVLAGLGAALPTLLVARWAMRRANSPA
jgi:hypothetical protein